MQCPQLILCLLLLLLLCPPLGCSAGGDGGDFGEWATDDSGLPLYRFTFNQSAGASSSIGSYARRAKDSAEVR
jgi:hypothetical protein